MTSINLGNAIDDGQGVKLETLRLAGLRHRAIFATMQFTACRAGAVTKRRVGDFQYDGTQFVLWLQEKGDKSREIPVRHDLKGYIRA